MAKERVDLKVSDLDDIFSRAQAAVVLNNVFMKNQPKSFAWVHKGQSKQGMRYGIGTLRTGGKDYRVTVSHEPAGKITRLAFEEDV